MVTAHDEQADAALPLVRRRPAHHQMVALRALGPPRAVDRAVAALAGPRHASQQELEGVEGL